MRATPLNTAMQWLQAGLAWAMLSRWGWRWLVAASSVPLLLLMLLYPLLPESPYWLLATGRTREVRILLQRIARMNGRDLPPGRLQPSAQAGAKVAFLYMLVKDMLVQASCAAAAPRAHAWTRAFTSESAAKPADCS